MGMRNSILLLLSLILYSWGIAIATKANVVQQQKFNEEMIIKPLPKGKIYTHVQFSTEWSANFNDQSTFQHYDLFPRSIGDLITRVGIEEMTLQFTQGRWSYSEWGYPIRSAPVGVELIAWFKPMEKGVDAQWSELTHSLSGLFCASMQSLYKVPHHTSSPHRSFRPEGASNVYHGGEEAELSSPAIYNTKTNSTTPLEIRYGNLPRESVCTENLTPWIKLLPCREQSGLGKLLNPLKLYDVYYHSMSITIRKICKKDQDSCQSPILEIIQTLSIVYDIPPKDNNKETIDIQLETLFGVNGGLSSCPLASSSKVYVQDQSNLNNLQVIPQPTEKKGQYFVYDLTKYTPQDQLFLKFSWNRYFTKESSPITAHSHLTGYGQERGGIAIQVYNHHNQPINVTYYHAIPWYLRVYFHTFKFSINDQPILNESEFKFKKVNPSEIRSSPSTIEVSFELEGNSVASMSIDFDKVFLHYSEHPPDANRGFDLGSGVVTAHISQKEFKQPIDIEWSDNIYPNNNDKDKDPTSTTPVRIYTEGLLITLPTPDFSMLYNVITLTGTVFALFFGSMFNILIRRLCDTFTGEDFVSDRPIARIYRRIMRFIDGKKEKL